MYTNKGNKSNENPYTPIKKECKNDVCFCTGRCQEITGYKHKKTGETISVLDYHKEFNTSK